MPALNGTEAATGRALDRSHLSSLNTAEEEQERVGKIVVDYVNVSMQLNSSLTHQLIHHRWEIDMAGLGSQCEQEKGRGRCSTTSNINRGGTPESERLTAAIVMSSTVPDAIPALSLSTTAPTYMYGYVPANAPRNTPADMLGNTPGNAPGNAPGNTPANAPATALGNTLANAVGDTPANAVGDCQIHRRLAE
ncbi:hypothetical protein BDZ89DRAFT_1047836 [Hymenopellis radicata]|nr:hypothetical protein BDZ89DRAFT_1047836 [Hymenopellis radicata]